MLRYSNPHSHIDFENVRITIPSNGIFQGLQKEFIEIMRSENEICKDNISYTIPKHRMNILK